MALTKTISSSNVQTNATINPNAIDINKIYKQKFSTCYNYGKVGYIAKNCHSSKIIKSSRSKRDHKLNKEGSGSSTL